MERKRVIAGVLIVAATAACSSTQPVARPAPPPAAAERERPADLSSPTTALPTPATSPTPSPRVAVRVKAQGSKPRPLTAFESCEALLARMKREALKQVTPWGLHHGGGGVAMGAPVAAAGSAGAAPAPAAASGPAFSGTNNQ